MADPSARLAGSECKNGRNARRNFAAKIRLFETSVSYGKKRYDQHKRSIEAGPGSAEFTELPQ